MDTLLSLVVILRFIVYVPVDLKVYTGFIPSKSYIPSPSKSHSYFVILAPEVSVDFEASNVTGTFFVTLLVILGTSYALLDGLYSDL